jgi:tetratricopeptide (TPR) repeat protein
MEAQIQEVIVGVSASHRLLTHLGRVAWAQGLCDKAADYWLKALQEGDAFAGYELSRVGKEDSLPSDLQLVLAERAYTQAISLREKDDYPTAQQWFGHAFELAPQHRSAEALASQYEKDGRFPEVRKLWQRMLDRLSPSDPDYWWATARLLEQDGKWTAAGESYQQGAKLSTDPYDFWLHAARAWEKTPEWSRAASAYKNAAATTSYPALAYLGLGLGYSGQGNYQNALHYLQLAQNADPAYFRSYYYMGLTYYRMLDFENARHNLDLALERNPDDASIMHLLARTWYDMGKPETAEMWLVRAINQLNPSPATWWLQLGDWRLAQGRCEDAAQAYSSAKIAGADVSAIQTKTPRFAEVCGENHSLLADPSQDTR